MKSVGISLFMFYMSACISLHSGCEGISGNEVQFLLFLTSALDGCVLSTSPSHRFDTMAAPTCNHSAGGWVGSRASWAFWRRNKSVDPTWCRTLYQPSSSLFIILGTISVHKNDTMRHSVGNGMCDRRRGIN